MATPTPTHAIGRRLTAARLYRGWALDALAIRAAISPQRLTRYEATGDLPCDDLLRLAAALRVPVAHFLGPCVLCGGSEHAASLPAPAMPPGRVEEGTVVG